MNTLQKVDARPLMENKQRLTDAQSELYALICNVCKGSKGLKKEDTFAIYKKYARGKGETYSTNSEGVRVWRWVDWCDWEWNRNFNSWLFRSLGSLVMKGYLTVIPTIDFSNCDGCEKTMVEAQGAEIIEGME